MVSSLRLRRSNPIFHPKNKQEGVDYSTPFVFIATRQIYLQEDAMKTKWLRSNFLRSDMAVPLRRA